MKVEELYLMSERGWQRRENQRGRHRDRETKRQREGGRGRRSEKAKDRKKA